MKNDKKYYRTVRVHIIIESDEKKVRSDDRPDLVEIQLCIN